MKYASEAMLNTSVADWKPIPADRFAEALHTYATVCSADGPGDHGNEGMGGIYPQAYKLDHSGTVTVWYAPSGGKAPDVVHSPVLLMIQNERGVLCFQSLLYGLDSYGLGAKPVMRNSQRDGRIR